MVSLFHIFRLKQNGQHFANEISEYILLYENCILIEISLTSVSNLQW